MRLRECVIVKYNTDPKEPELTQQDCWVPEQCAILGNYINIKIADEAWEQWKIQEVSTKFKEPSEILNELEKLKANCKSTYDALISLGLDVDADENYSRLQWTGKWFDPNSCLAAHIYMVADSVEEAIGKSMAPKEDDSRIWIEELLSNEITTSREKLLQAERQSMARSAVIDYVRAENKQLRDLLGVDDKNKDFGAGEKLRLLRVALAQSEEEVERLRTKLEKIKRSLVE